MSYTKNCAWLRLSPLARSAVYLLPFILSACDPGYSVARWAGAPIDKTTYHAAYGLAEAEAASTHDILAEIRKPCREERLPFFVQEYFSRTHEPGVLAAFRNLALKTQPEYVQRTFAQALDSCDHKIPRERLEEWRKILEEVLASPKLRAVYRPAFERALRRSRENPEHFRSLSEEAKKRAKKNRARR